MHRGVGQVQEEFFGVPTRARVRVLVAEAFEEGLQAVGVVRVDVGSGRRWASIRALFRQDGADGGLQ
eukprot:8945336-Heterocapsa_arctica.AAC.1